MIYIINNTAYITINIAIINIINNIDYMSY